MTSYRRENRTVTAAEIFARHLPNRDFRTGPALPPPSPDLDAAETADWNRERATALHLRKTPARFADALADHRQVRDWAEAYLRDRRAASWLLLIGATGTGKTHLAYGALRYLAESGYAPIGWQSVNAADLYARLRPGGSSDPEAAFASLADTPILLLDDLGATRMSEFAEEITYRLIDHRYAAGLATIITTNASPRQLAERFGDRTASRLHEMCMRVSLGTEDRRAAPETAA